MLKKITFSLVLFVNVLFSYGQSYWVDIINNDRSNGLSKVDKAYNDSKSIENLISREIIRNESGAFSTSPNFSSDFMKQGDFPFYLYALWNERFIFSDYISAGFSKEISDNVNAFYNHTYSDITLSSGIAYLKGITARNYNNFSLYKKCNAEISVIRDWQFCGVFENMNKSGLDIIYDPESNPKNTKPFEANSNGKVQWYKPAVVDPTESYTLFSGHNEYGSGVHYAQTFVNNDTDRKVLLRLGSSDRIKAWINDIVVFESARNANTDIDAYNVMLNLPKGKNRLLIKVSGESSSSYFSARFTDGNGDILTGMTYSSDYSDYNTSTAEQLDVHEIKTKYEVYFEHKATTEPTNFLYTYCLAKTYLRNEKHQEAKDVILPLYEANPKSSILRRLMIEIYYLEENYTSLNELKENLQKDDENYHLSMEYKFQNTDELFRMSMTDMEAFLKKYSDLVQNDLITYTVQLVSSLRKEDKRQTRVYLDKLIQVANSMESVNLLKAYTPIYSSIFNDTKTHVKILEGMNKKFFDYDVRSQLSNYYDDINKMPKAYAFLMENAKNMDNDFLTSRDLVYYLQKHERYKESLPHLERMLQIYPYSFITMELKGDALLQLDRKDEALKCYGESLIYNSGNADLRRKMEDITNKKDLIEEFVEKDIYAYIAQTKNKNIPNNYGFNVLKNDAILELYSEAGGRGRYTTAYEITSDKGVERFKEYNLNLYGNYTIIKSEIVKKEGSINPADANGSSFVFTGLSIGDVVLIDYQKGFTSFGRFYKDFVDYFTFDGFHPVVSKKYVLIAPQDKPLSYLVTKEGLDFSTKEQDGNKIYTWQLKDHPGCAHSEEYMPELVDFASVLHISTIKNWNEIANWYSDLVRSQMIIDNEVKKEFKVIFPEENVTGLSEEERAKRIYYYMMKNFNYSSVNFRQSGYIPQKPSKTLLTKLGDCKDFSTVFVTFARLAGLDADLVLCLTSDNGKKSILLPSQDFNHCIVRVMLNGKEQFLELTDKNLPFKALPNGVRNSSILVIPKNSNSAGEPSELRTLENPTRMMNTLTNQVEMHVTTENQTFKLKTTLEGENRSYWADVFDSPTYETYKKTISEYYQKRINSGVKLDTVFTLVTGKEAKELSYETQLSLNEKLNKIGNFKILKIPYVNFEYTGGIISETERKHMIEYQQYEETDIYKVNYDVFLDEPGEFFEIPANKNLTYKGHSYVRTYKKVGPKHLRIEVIAKPSTENISPENYAEFKAFVKSIIESKDEFIGFK
ncbi:MAG: transglutaminase domain-containing protein [Crocinitomicaceae bacterium]